MTDSPESPIPTWLLEIREKEKDLERNKLINNQIKIDDGEIKSYYILMLLGSACLLPWKSYITAVDYFQDIYPGTNIEYWLALVYNGPLIIGMIYITFWGRKSISLNTRIKGALFILTIFVAIVLYIDHLLHISYINTHQGFKLTLLSMGICGIATSVLQSSLYGIAGLLSKHHTQALQVGKGWAGLVVVLIRIITKPTPLSLRQSTLIYFGFTVACLFLAFLLYFEFKKIPFVAKHLSLLFESKKLLYNKKRLSFDQLHKKNINQNNDNKGDYISLSINDNNNNNNNNNIGKSENTLLLSDKKVLYNEIENIENEKIIKKELPTKYDVINTFKLIWKPVVVVWAAFTICLGLFPGVSTSFKSQHGWGDWLPVLMILWFDIGDLIGKSLPAYHLAFNPNNVNKMFPLLLLHACWIILFILGVQNPSSPIFGDEIYYTLIVLGLGTSTGYLACSGLMVSPMFVEGSKDKEIAGMISTFCLAFGLFSGSCLGVIFSYTILPKAV